MRSFFSLLLSCLVVAPLGAADYVWAETDKPLYYFADVCDEPVVETALSMFAHDLQTVTGSALSVCGRRSKDVKPQLYIMTLDGSRAQSRLLNRWKVNTQGVMGEWEAFGLRTVCTDGDTALLVMGSDARGTAYGILELSRLAGVSPWCWWADVVPEKRETLSLPVGYVTTQKPSIAYRGIFLNDEDWGLMPWSSFTYEPSDEKGRIGEKTYSRIFELLLRLRANIIWPAMHDCSVPFYRVAGAKDAANRYGIVVGTSHCEPLMRNNVSEWDRGRYGEYNFFMNRDSLLSYWNERVGEVAPYENVYTVGMRGVHDSGLEGANTMAEKKALLEDVIAAQRDILKRNLNRDISDIPQIFVPYKEVLEVLDSGLQVPDDVTLMWCDDNYGHITRLSSPEQRVRSGGAGVYYHISYWGRPHDYLWLSTAQPGLIYSEMKKAYDSGAEKIWILNVGDIKPAEYNIEFFMDLAWNISSITPLTINNHIKKWLAREFGEANSASLSDVMRGYYRLAALRKPEFMGWSRVEVGGVPRGLTPVADTEFNPLEFGNEVTQRLQEYAAIKDSVLAVEQRIVPSRKDAYFELVKYPVCAAEAMNRKILYAQLARKDAACRLERYSEFARLSMDAYDELVALTNRYNHEIANGKWNNMMSMAPRNLPVFQRPLLPDTAAPRKLDDEKPSCKDYVALNGSQYDFASPGACYIQMLGHSMSALSLPKGGSVSYNIITEECGDARLWLAFVPTHPVDGGKLRCSVTIDNNAPVEISFATVGRSPAWMDNVLRGQALHFVDCQISSAGQHTVTIQAIDDGVYIDQLMLDFDVERMFYAIPVCAACI